MKILKPSYKLDLIRPLRPSGSVGGTNGLHDMVIYDGLPYGLHDMVINDVLPNNG